MNFWVTSINHCLLDLFLGFKAKCYLPYKPQDVGKTVNVDLNFKETSKAKLDCKAEKGLSVPLLAFWLNNILVVNLI